MGEQPLEPGTDPADPVTVHAGGPGGRGAAVKGLRQGKEPEEQRELRAGMEQGTAGHGGCWQHPTRLGVPLQKPIPRG